MVGGAGTYCLHDRMEAVGYKQEIAWKKSAGQSLSPRDVPQRATKRTGPCALSANDAEADSKPRQPTSSLKKYFPDYTTVCMRMLTAALFRLTPTWSCCKISQL